MHGTDDETTGRSKLAGDTTYADVDVRPDQVGQLAESINTIDCTWLDTIVDWLGQIGDAFDGLGLGDIGFDW